MILVDSSVWIDHLRSVVGGLHRALLDGRVVQHAFVTTELALGSLANRGQVIDYLAALPQVVPVHEGELLDFISRNKLSGVGIGLVDAHLLASCCGTGHRLWTRDKRLKLQAERLDCAHPE